MTFGLFMILLGAASLSAQLVQPKRSRRAA